MKTKIAEYDPAVMTIDDVEALRDTGHELILTADMRIAAYADVEKEA
jgi:hypothetical protein